MEIPPGSTPFSNDAPHVDVTSHVHRSEKTYFTLMVVVQVILVLFMVVSIVGIGYIIGFLIFGAIAQGLFMGYIRGNAVHIGHDQFPDLDARLQRIAGQLGMRAPDTFILQGDGLINAFATRYFGRTFVVLYSDVVELAYEQGSDVVDFVLAHELAHHKRNHLTKGMLLWPANVTPFLGKAYSRACEFTCDAVANAAVPGAGVRGIGLLAAGKRLYGRIDPAAYIHQMHREGGFWVWFAEILSTHPKLPRRMQALHGGGIAPAPLVEGEAR